MSFATRLLPETLRELGWAAIGAAYAAIGTPLAHPSRIFRLQNLTNAALYFSFDGINDHEALPINGFLLIDVTANKTASSGFFIVKGTTVYVKQLGVATSGSVYLSTYYGHN